MYAIPVSDLVKGEMRNVNLKQAAEEVDRIVLRMGCFRSSLVSLYGRIAESCDRVRTELLDAVWYIVLRTEFVLCVLPMDESFDRRGSRAWVDEYLIDDCNILQVVSLLSAFTCGQCLR